MLSTDFNFAGASEEYLQDGTRQDYALNGRFRSTSLGLSARYGFTDKFEMEARPQFKHISYEADPVILDCVPDLLDCDGMYDLAEARANIIDFSAARLGAANLNMMARYNLLRGYVVLTPELGIKIPLGYEAPQGTFSDVPSLTVGDDATLGDGQIDVWAAILFGAYIPWTRTFVRADVGYQHRFSSPGDQLIASGKVGQFIGQRFIVFAGARMAETLFQGEPVGQTFVDTNPSQSAADYQFSFVEIQELYLDRNFIQFEAGALIKFEQVELQLAYADILDGDNIANLRSVNVGVVTQFAGLTAPRGEPEEAEPTEEVETIEEVIIVPIEEGGEQSDPPEDDGAEVEVIEEVIIEEVPADPGADESSEDEGDEGDDGTEAGEDAAPDDEDAPRQKKGVPETAREDPADAKGP